MEQLDLDKICARAASLLVGRKVRSLNYDSRFDFGAWSKSIPDINPIYAMTIRHHYEVSIHAQKGVFPYEILRSKAPNQSESEWEFQKGLYESYTRSPWGRALNKTKIISNKQNYSIKGWDSVQQEYFYKDYPVYHSIESYFFDIVREQKINYPNRLLVIEPLTIPTKIVNDVEVVDDTIEVSPICRIVHEEDIIFYKENELSIIVDGYRNFDGVEYPNFKSFDKNFIYYSTAIRKDSKGLPIYESISIYRHDWGYVPCRKLGGKAQVVKGEIFHESYFADALAELNGIIRLHSNLDMSTYSVVYPIPVRRDFDCTNYENGSPCRDGKIWYANPDGETGEYRQCSECKGTGRRSRRGPTSEFVVTDKDMDGNNVLPLSEVIQFVSPPTTALEFLSKQIEAKEEKAFAFIFKSSEKIQNTAEGSHLEKDEYHSLLVQFSNELFDLLSFSIEGMGFYRYQSSFQNPTISRPTTFSFRSSSEITEEIKLSSESKMPSPYIQELVNEGADTRFNSSPIAKDKIRLAMELNKLWNTPELELRTWLGKTVSDVDIIIKQQIAFLLDKAFDEYENFSSLNRDEQIIIITKYAEEIKTSMPKEQSIFSADSLAQ